MDSFDFSPLFRSTIGFDRMMNMLDATARLDGIPSYPPYNIEATGENTYRVSMAVAGFGAEDLDVTAKDGALIVTGRAAKDDDKVRYLHRGIARRAFERRFQLADHIRVSGASLDNGLLHVDLTREIPEALKPRKIEIVSAGGAKEIEQKAA